MSQPQDRRVAERYPVNADARCDFLSPVLEDFGPTRIKDLSTEGIGLIVSNSVAPGMLLALTLDNRPRSFSKTVLVRVAHVTAQHGGTFLVGGTFSAPLTYEELTKLVM